MNKQRRDDDSHRLFPFLEKEYGIYVQKSTLIKPYVSIIETDRGKWVLKKYRTFLEASRQQVFFRLLNNSGFQAAPAIEGVISFENEYWMLQTYISSSRPFHYADEKDRYDSLSLLYMYHAYSQPLLHHPFFATMLPHYSLYEKWHQRYEQFLYALPVLKQLMKDEELSFILYCARSFFERFPHFFSSFIAEKKTIIHGDVASHNFLRTEKAVYLIDYDLIAVAPPAIDYLQYASRVLPYVQWSFAYLERQPLLQPLVTKPWFLTALLFPADLMRECRVIVQRGKPFSLPYFEHRKQFVQKIMNMIR